MLQIFNYDCKGQNLILAERCTDYLFDYFTKMYDDRSDDYANARDVRNYFENVVRARANRLSEILDSITQEEYYTITIDDLKMAVELNNRI